MGNKQEFTMKLHIVGLHRLKPADGIKIPNTQSKYQYEITFFGIISSL
jgi:hypothetical protein